MNYTTIVQTHSGVVASFVFGHYWVIRTVQNIFSSNCTEAFLLLNISCLAVIWVSVISSSVQITINSVHDTAGSMGMLRFVMSAGDLNDFLYEDVISHLFFLTFLGILKVIALFFASISFDLFLVNLYKARPGIKLLIFLEVEIQLSNRSYTTQWLYYIIIWYYIK